MIVHPSHITRISDASTFDEICDACGATDTRGSDLLSKPCSGSRSSKPIPECKKPTMVSFKEYWFRRYEIEHPPPVLTKHDFTERFIQGEFGNRTPVYTTIQQLKEADPTCLYHLRNKQAGGTTLYKLFKDEAICRWSSLGESGWYAGQMIPSWLEEHLLIQGEVQVALPELGGFGLDLYYSRVPEPMRPSLLKGGKQVTGTTASSLLRTLLCPNSHEWLMTLLERYKHHVVEFSTYDCEYGVIPGFNTVFWEVRKY